MLHILLQMTMSTAKYVARIFPTDSCQNEGCKCLIRQRWKKVFSLLLADLSLERSFRLSEYKLLKDRARRTKTVTCMNNSKLRIHPYKMERIWWVKGIILRVYRTVPLEDNHLRGRFCL